jgi:MraZ protein
MPLLVGRHVNKIDRKGRVSVPKPFRDALTAPGGVFAGVFAYPLFKEPAIEACGEEFMTRLAASLDDLSMFSDDQDDLASALLENAHQLAFDPEGRVVLPAELVAHAGIDGEVLFVGRGRRFQVWNPSAYLEKRSVVFDRLRTRGATLPLRPAGESEA